MNITTLDCETKDIKPRPEYPPKPVGLAIRWPEKKYEYMSWGHPDGNNCTYEDVRRTIHKIWDSKTKLLFHNGAFDIEVICEEFGLPWPDDNRIHDTLVIAFLHDPRSPSLSLKPLAERFLNEPPEERDKLREWILGNLRIKTSTGEIIRSTTRVRGTRAIPPTKWGAYIAYAPASIVGPYAIGDVKRTWKLFKWFSKHSDIPTDWYRETEIPLLRIKVDMEKHGVGLHVPRLVKMQKAFTAQLELEERALCEFFNLNYTGVLAGAVNFGSRDQLANFLDENHFVDSWEKTPSGERAVGIDALRRTVNSKKLIVTLENRAVLRHYLNGFINPWLNRDSNRLYTTYHTVRGEDKNGTRSGRFSSSGPNLENVSANPENNKNRIVLERLQKIFKKRHGYNWRGLRDVLIADDDTVFLGRDYSQQEPRILAHFENNLLKKVYNDNPRTDLYEYSRNSLEANTGRSLTRRVIKDVILGMVYGLGIKALSEKLGMDLSQAKELKNGVIATLGDYSELVKKLRYDEGAYTWAGRYYPVETPRMIGGRMRDFYYRQVNYLVQPSAAECTKKAIVNIDRASLSMYMQLQEHDEIIGSCYDNPEGTMKLFKECMEDVKFRVPMLTDGAMGKSWARLKDCE